MWTFIFYLLFPPQVHGLCSQHLVTAWSALIGRILCWLHRLQVGPTSCSYLFFSCLYGRKSSSLPVVTGVLCVCVLGLLLGCHTLLLKVRPQTFKSHECRFLFLIVICDFMSDGQKKAELNSRWVNVWCNNKWSKIGKNKVWKDMRWHILCVW